MPQLSSSPSEARLREHAERNLGSLVIAIEFTLISVMVGVILFPLMDYGTALLRTMRYEYWLYIISGLLLILLMWTQVISHSLSFVGWPIDVGHNLLYIVFALVLGIQMHFLEDPRGWFALSVVSTGIALLLVYYDAGVIEGRMQGASGSSLELFNAAMQRQRAVLQSTRIALADSILNVVLVVGLPQLFIDLPGHIVLVALQIIFIYVFTSRTIRVFKSWTGPIVRKAMDELASEGAELGRQE